MELKVLERHNKILEQFSFVDQTGYFYKGESGYLYNIDGIESKLYENLNMTQFKFLYPRLILNMLDNYPKKEKIYLNSKNEETLRCLIKNINLLSGENNSNNRFFINSLFISLLHPYHPYHKYKSTSEKQLSRNLASIVTFYNKIILNELLSLNKEKIIHINTDLIFHTGELDFKDIDYVNISENKKVDFLKFENNISFLYYCNNQVFPKHKVNSVRYRKLESELKSHIRNSKLEKLGF